MTRFALLLLVLVAGVAGAQPATMNCRSSATNCSAAAFKSNGTGLVLDLSSSTATTALQFQNGAGINFSLADSDAYIIRSASNTLRAGNGTASSFRSGSLTLGTGAGNDAIAVATTGAWTHLGAGSNDRMKSDGVNILFDTNINVAGVSNIVYFGGVTNGAYIQSTGTTNVTIGTGNAPRVAVGNSNVNPGTNDGVDVGATGVAWKTLWLSRGAVLNDGNTVKWTNPPVSDNTETQSQLVYNTDAQEPAFATATRKYNPLGQAKEWVIEKRVMVADIGFESTTCPTANPGLRGTGAAAVTFTCTDAAAATNVTVSGESYRNSVTTTTANTVSIVDVSAATAKLELGPKLLQRVSIPAGSTASVRIWVALVPTATSLSGVDTGAISVVGFRFSTAVPDTNWQACSGDAASVVCTDTGTAPTTATNLVLEIDCREKTTCRFLINGSLVATRSTTMPAQTTQLGQRVLVQTTNTTAKSLGFGRAALQIN